MFWNGWKQSDQQTLHRATWWASNKPEYHHLLASGVAWWGNFQFQSTLSGLRKGSQAGRPPNSEGSLYIQSVTSWDVGKQCILYTFSCPCLYVKLPMPGSYSKPICVANWANHLRQQSGEGIVHMHLPLKNSWLLKESENRIKRKCGV